MVAIRDIKGVTADLEGKLRTQGIDNSDELLAKVKTPAERRVLAVSVGMEVKAILELANRADLIRVKGVAGSFSDLLENAGVDTVKELATRVPANLHAKLVQVNEQMKISHRTPTTEMVADWVAQAKLLPKTLEY